MTRILVTNDDGYDAPGLAALKEVATEFGEVCVIAPRDAHSYQGHRITTDGALVLVETGPAEFHLSGTPADCVRVALRSLFPDVDLVLAGINRGGNLGVDLYISGTVGAVREAALLGRKSIAVSQYIRKGVPLDWTTSQRLARPILARLIAEASEPKAYWNVNLPHLDHGQQAEAIECDPDNEPLDVRFSREGDKLYYAGTYVSRPRTPGRDIDLCFGGAITVSRLRL